MTRGNKVYIESHGCSASLADSEMNAGELSKGGYSIVDSPEEADVSLLVTCTVKSATANKMAHRIRQLSKNKMPLVVAGCMPKTEQARIEKMNPDAGLLGPNSIENVRQVVESALDGRKMVMIDDSPRPKVGLPRLRVNPIISIVEIGSGCLSGCTFCQVKIAKGRLASYPPDLILDEVRTSLRDGCMEIWLTSTDNGCYGVDMGMDLAELVSAVGSVDGNFFTRVGMMNPVHQRRSFERLLNAYEAKQIYKFLHIPVQSGSNRVLKLMKRGHSVWDFRRMADAFRQRFPYSSISTDVIVGFPSETDDEFDETIQLIETTTPDVVNISKYGMRPGTDAAMLEQIPPEIINERSRRMTECVRRTSLERNKCWIGWKGKCLVDEMGKREGTMIARNPAYKPVVIGGNSDLLGTMLDLCVSGAAETYLLGQII